MLKLFTLPGEGKIRSPSPFAWKTEAMLRLSGLDFEKEYVADLSKMPKGKVPVLQDGEKLIPDSSLIQRYLTETYGIDLDKHLTPEQKAIRKKKCTDMVSEDTRNPIFTPSEKEI